MNLEGASEQAWEFLFLLSHKTIINETSQLMKRYVWFHSSFSLHNVHKLQCMYKINVAGLNSLLWSINYTVATDDAVNFTLPIIKWPQSHITTVNPIPIVIPQNTCKLYKLWMYISSYNINKYVNTCVCVVGLVCMRTCVRACMCLCVIHIIKVLYILSRVHTQLCIWYYRKLINAMTNQ